VEVYWTESLMMFWWVVFGKIICKIGFAWCSENFEVALFCSVAYPVEAHVDRSRSLLIDHVISNAACGGVVCLDGCCLLGIAHFVECIAKDFALFRVDEESSSFGFGCQQHDVFDDAGDIEDCSIVEHQFGRIGFCSEVDVSAGSTASFCDR
jgi:hypothetical protein